MPSYTDYYPDDVSEKLDEINMELESITPKDREFLLLWLRSKGQRAKLEGQPKMLAMYQGAELADNLVRCIRDDVFDEFDHEYTDYLFRCIASGESQDIAKDMLQEYLDEKRLMYELILISEHLTDNEMINSLMNVLREEPKEEWYEELSVLCADSVVLSRYYSSVFGLPEKEVCPALKKNLPETGSIVYMVLADGAPPEAVMYVKDVRDGDNDRFLPVFCHEDMASGGLEYFTMSGAEASHIPMAKAFDGDSNLERLFLLLKEKTDFSDNAYLEKPTATMVAEKYMRKRIGNKDKFNKTIGRISENMYNSRSWSLGAGERGEKLAAAPAYAKVKALRMHMMKFEVSGSYAIGLKDVIELMQEECREQQELVDKVFQSMELYAKEGLAEERQAAAERSKENLKLKDNEQQKVSSR